MVLWEIEKLIKKGDYDYAIVRNHPNATKNGYVLLHRIIMENFVGRLLTKDEVVHHVDKNKHNNDISNLRIMSKGKHVSMHQHDNYPNGKTKIELECENCHMKFERELRNYKPSNLHYFCSRSCNGKYYVNITNNLKKNKNYKTKLKREI